MSVKPVTLRRIIMKKTDYQSIVNEWVVLVGVPLNTYISKFFRTGWEKVIQHDGIYDMKVHYKKIYASYLRLLAELIMKLDEQANGDSGFLDARLSADMFPLKVQAKVAASFAVRACTSGIGGADPEPGERINSAHGLISYINEVAEFVEKSDQPHLESVEDKAGFKSFTMEAEDYVNLFSLPNFFFHLSMVYAIAKNQGFLVTKGDFDGIHEYPEGFSWEA